MLRRHSLERSWTGSWPLPELLHLLLQNQVSIRLCLTLLRMVASFPCYCGPSWDLRLTRFCIEEENREGGGQAEGRRGVKGIAPCISTDHSSDQDESVQSQPKNKKKEDTIKPLFWAQAGFCIWFRHAQIYRRTSIKPCTHTYHNPHWVHQERV